jgi:tRNA (uracil-5-)-methyltransferase
VNNYIYKTTTDPSIPLTTIREKKLYTTENDTFATEHIGSYIFKTRAGSFFQNNSSILPSFLSYVRSKILPAQPDASQPIKYLLDAYCGSGLFAITLSPLFTSVLGIELDPWGVSSARENAKLNGVEHAGFIEADAAALFQDVPYPAENTVLVIDPPRKGCSTDFLKQLLRYGPARVVYVSCNVGSQARDVGCLVRGWCGEDWWKVEGREDEGREVGRFRYEIEELRGFDFFPQTSHVEGLCVLRRVVNDMERAWDEGRVESQLRASG